MEYQVGDIRIKSGRGEIWINIKVEKLWL